MSVSRLEDINGKSKTREGVASYQGYLTEVGISEIANHELYGRVYHFNTEYNADIRQSDKLTSGEGQKYSVQNVFHKKGCTLSFTRAVIIKDVGS